MWIFLSIFLITILYFGIALIKPIFQKKLPFNICSICIAVSFTWLILLVGFILGWNIDPVLIAVLMGQSITGIMYAMENYFKSHKLSDFWIVRIYIIVAGTLVIYNLLTGPIEFLLLSLSAVFVAGVFVFLKVITSNQKQKNDNEKSKLKNRLDNCC